MKSIASAGLMTVFWLSGGAFAVQAEDAPSLDAFKQCVSIQDDAARLACFDRAAAGFDFTEAAKSLKEADALRAEAQQLKQEKKALAEAKRQQDAAMEAKKTEEFGKRDAEVRTVDRIDTTLRRVIEPRVGGKVLVLANGMVWQIDDGGRTGPLKPGMELHINKTAFGGYLLTFELSRRTFRVKRVN